MVLNYLRVDHEGFAKLVREHAPVLDNSADYEKENGLRGGWPSWKDIHEKADKDDYNRRDQTYYFLEIVNKGPGEADDVFLTGSEGGTPFHVRGLAEGESRLLPLRVFGRHTNLTRTPSRTITRAWLVFRGAWWKRTKELEIPDANPMNLMYTNLPNGVARAYPSFDTEGGSGASSPK